MEEIRNECRNSVINLERKKPLERYRGRYEDNIKMHFRQMGNESVDWVHIG
jgi:hypothetical protein